MRVIILAGGLGSRISEETFDKPKPMVRLGKYPLLWHLMNIFAIQGHKDFLVASGYKSYVIDDWIAKREENNILNGWNITNLYTGLATQTGGRIAKCFNLVGNETMIATYGDGLANINLTSLLNFHSSHGKLATITAVRPPARFGVLQMNDSQVIHFGEKDQSDAGWINGGFFVLEPEVAGFIESDNEPFEIGALPRLVRQNQLMAYSHLGFWKPMDTLREKLELQAYAELETPPWLT